ncbi:MAG: hypothetical protein P3A28_07995 [Gemmatimonadota bacterium]|nr:hypothetical protein [Gemmatimonadota bacterium]
MPDRLPSLVLLVGFWVPAVLAGRAAAEFAQRRAGRVRPALLYSGMAAFVLASSAVWYIINLSTVPPYIPGATRDPTFVPPGGAAALGVITGVMVLPVSALACWLAFRGRSRSLAHTASR